MSKKFNIETEAFYSIEKCLQNPMKLYVFGENEEQKGSTIMGGGQAVIRPCPNSFGFCTLSNIRNYWDDNSYKTNILRIEIDLEELKERYLEYECIVFPKNGLGTGRARMQKYCPKTFLYLCKCLLEQFGFNNLYYLTPPKF